jgi:uncharacterized membrane protein YhaH (DUF805 family)
LYGKVPESYVASVFFFKKLIYKKDDPMDWYLKVLKNYTVFDGRARRKEYWMFVLFNMVFTFVLGFLDGILSAGFLVVLYYLAVLLPWIAVAVRRLHDVGKSGWFLFIGLIPIIGAIWLLVLYCIDGDAGENKYGPNPKEDVQQAYIKRGMQYGKTIYGNR